MRLLQRWVMRVLEPVYRAGYADGVRDAKAVRAAADRDERAAGWPACE